MIPQIAPESDLWTVARLACQFQVSYSVMQTALDLIGAAPSLALNGVAYYALDDERAELIREYLRTRAATDKLHPRGEWTADLPIRENFRPRNPGE